MRTGKCRAADSRPTGLDQGKQAVSANTRWGAAFFPSDGQGCLSEVQKTAPLDGQNLPASNTDTEYKEHSKTERVESTRCRYGEFQNVFLSGEECSRLETAYPGKAAEYIERLSRYMASNDRHYANHYATIKKWLDDDSKGRSAKSYTYDDNEGECL